MLVGREDERRELDSLLQSARDERSAVLVLRGESGIGKTALLEYAEQQASDMKVLRCVGIEAEHELPFAGMHQLVRPCLDLIERLPAPQAAAMRSALGLAAGGVDDRFLVSLGLLSLLAEACEDGPLLCCVDDAQWLDSASAEALVFAARRFEAEPIAVLMAVREGDLRNFDAPGVPELRLGALGEEDAFALLTQRLEHEASADVLAGLLTAARGNPLALLELPAALSEEQLVGAEPILGPPPVRPVIEESFRARVAALPETTRQMLLLAAADEAGDLAAVEMGAARLGLDGSELEVAERRGLVRLDGAVTFRHPLVRSAIYRSASRAERKKAHETLGSVVDDPTRRAWHRALVAEGADEGLAAELEAAGAQALVRGAQSTASAAFERAAELSEDDSRRGHRLCLAAQAAQDGGRPDAALALVERARAFVTDPVDVALMNLVLATDTGRRGSPAEGRGHLRAASAAIADIAPEQATEMLIWVVFTSLQGGRVERVLQEIEPALDAIAAPGELGRFARALVAGATAMFDGSAAAAGERFAEAIEVGKGFENGRSVVMNAFIYAFVGDFARSRAVSAQAIERARVEGSVASLVGTFPLLGLGQLGEGRIAAAEATVAEGLELAERLGYENDTTGLLALRARIGAQRGREADSRADAEAAMRRSLATELTYATEQARLALAELELGLGNAREAIEPLEQLNPRPLPPVALMATPDLIDAALRIGEPERAERALARFEAWAPVSRAPVVEAMVTRCGAVLAEDAEEADRLFREALEAHARESPPLETARTQLAYGERLRRDRRRVEARTQLRTALDTFEGVGAVPWAERARGELQATGETARKRDVSTLDDLTPQELRIAQLVAAGATNREAGAQLFVSPKTVEYHLRKVFMKLGVGSRVELARVPLGEAVAVGDEGPD
jgi:DNA-binding CsgD family transcriptional regulator/tetratricopeptide (TPR) repeat protein